MRKKVSEILTLPEGSDISAASVLEHLRARGLDGDVEVNGRQIIIRVDPRALAGKLRRERAPLPADIIDGLEDRLGSPDWSARSKSERTRVTKARQLPPPLSVVVWLAAASGEGVPGYAPFGPPPDNVNEALEQFRMWRRSEYKRASGDARLDRQSSTDNLQSRLADSPLLALPFGVQAVAWLVKSGRDRDLFRCDVCRRWFLAGHGNETHCCEKCQESAANEKRKVGVYAHRAKNRAERTERLLKKFESAVTNAGGFRYREYCVKHVGGVLHIIDPYGLPLKTTLPQLAARLARLPRRRAK